MEVYKRTVRGEGEIGPELWAPGPPGVGLSHSRIHFHGDSHHDGVTGHISQRIGYGPLSSQHNWCSSTGLLIVSGNGGDFMIEKKVIFPPHPMFLVNFYHILLMSTSISKSQLAQMTAGRPWASETEKSHQPFLGSAPCTAWATSELQVIGWALWFRLQRLQAKFYE
jgi:hypothetical protein